MTDALLQLAGTRIHRFGARCCLGRTLGQLIRAELQLPYAGIELLQALLRARRVGQHQGPAAFVQPFVDFVPQLFGETTGQAGGLIAVALRGVNHQFASPRLGTGHGIGAEVAWNDQGKGQLALTDPGPGGLLIRLVDETEHMARFEPRHHVLPHVEIVFPVLHTLVKVDQGDAQGAGVGSRVPNAGKVEQAVQGRNQGNNKPRGQCARVSAEKRSLESGNGQNLQQQLHGLNLERFILSASLASLDHVIAARQCRKLRCHRRHRPTGCVTPPRRANQKRTNGFWARSRGGLSADIRQADQAGLDTPRQN